MAKKSQKNEYTRAQDDKGHSVLLSVRVPLDVEAALSRLVQSGRFPDYPTKSDIAREGIRRQLEELEKVTGTLIRNEMSRLRIALMNQEVEESEALFTDTTATLERNVSRLLSEGTTEARTRAIGLIRGHLIQAKNMSDYWHGRVVKEIGSRFGYLLKGDWEVEEE